MWRFAHTVACQADVGFAWEFWTDVENWSLDAAVDRVWVQPAFLPGALGTTLTRDGARTQWRITDLEPPTTAHLEIPAPGATLHITWTFRPEGGRSTLTQGMHLSGKRVSDYEQDIAATMEATVPAGMQQLAGAIDSAYARRSPRTTPRS